MTNDPALIFGNKLESRAILAASLLSHWTFHTANG
jgi:hypothetical protein